MRKGKFVIIEGGDGAGKSTFVNFLREKHPEFVYSKEPGGSIGFSHKIRELVLSPEAQNVDTLAMFCLFWASKAQNMARVVLPALKEGKIVVTDRFEVSTYAYQVGENAKLEPLFWKTREACLRNISPVYLNFDISVEAACSRMNGRDYNNHFDARNDEYRNRVRFWYKRFFNDRRVRSVTINADQPQESMLGEAYKSFKLALVL